jgi:hypothetical protein
MNTLADIHGLSVVLSFMQDNKLNQAYPERGSHIHLPRETKNLPYTVVCGHKSTHSYTEPLRVNSPIQRFSIFCSQPG